MTFDRRISLAIGLVLVGLFIQLVTSLWWTPLTFVLFAMFGLTAVILGALFFMRTVWMAVSPLDAKVDPDAASPPETAKEDA